MQLRLGFYPVFPLRNCEVLFLTLFLPVKLTTEILVVVRALLLSVWELF